MQNQLHNIKKWFAAAIPNPTSKNQEVQLGVHFEEIAEMLEATYDVETSIEMYKLATEYKTALPISHNLNREDLLDALCDQIVTAVGVAHMFDLNILDGLTEVNRSNWSKFVDDKPVFNEQGKISKGPSYTKPDLTGMF